MSPPRPALPCLLLALAACGTPGLRAPAPAPQDPDPSGPPSLRAYKEHYYRQLGGRFVGHLTEAELLRRIARARVLYLGDHHDDPELHAELRHLLDRVHEAGHRTVLGLEAIGEQDGTAVAAFLDGDIDSAELRRQVRERWPGSWLDSAQVDAPFYLHLLERARDRGAPVFALEPAPRRELWLRDAVMADSIRRAAHRHPTSLIVVVVGHAHLLGEGRLIERVGMPWVALGARPSVALAARMRSYRAPAEARYLLTSSGVVLARPRARQPASLADS